MRRVLTEPELAADLSARGLARAGMFSWAQAAERIHGIYQDVGRS
jgi:glycosyltransferase involved in cell wall biosynthesis